MIIKRDIYLNRLIQSKGDGFVKIVTGIRRCGKSYLLFKLFRSHLLKAGVNKKNIIEIALDKRKDARLRDPDAMYAFLSEKTKNARSRIYILIDEIQECKRPKAGHSETIDERDSREQEFYDILNEFRERRNVDLYVTGSNSRLLVTDVATQFRGRGEIIHISPLTFAEYFDAVGGDKYDAWSNYLLYGGMPELLSLKSDEAKKVYLEDPCKAVECDIEIFSYDRRFPFPVNASAVYQCFCLSVIE